MPIHPSSKQKSVATAVVVAKSWLLFYVGRLLVDSLSGHYPAYATLIEYLVLIGLLFPLMYWAIGPFYRLVRKPHPVAAPKQAAEER